MENKAILNKKIGERLRSLREKNGIKQYAFAKNYGYSTQQISKIENGKASLQESLARKIANDFNVRIEYLLCEDNYKTLGEKISLPVFKSKDYFFDYLNEIGICIKGNDSAHLSDKQKVDFGLKFAKICSDATKDRNPYLSDACNSIDYKTACVYDALTKPNTILTNNSFSISSKDWCKQISESELFELEDEIRDFIFFKFSRIKEKNSAK